MPFPPPHLGTQYTEFIRQICRKREARTYFEIGVERGLNFSAIQVDTAIGVDPAFALQVDVTANKNSALMYRMSSDAFFKRNLLRGTVVDLAFLDGMHVFEYLLRDFFNTEAACCAGSLILMHDCLPFDEEMISRRSLGGAWTGDVWKIIPILKKYRPDLKVTLIDCAPTGLVAVSRLNPHDKTLIDRYEEIISEYSQLSNDVVAVSAMYSENVIVRAEAVLHEFDHSLYFRL